MIRLPFVLQKGTGENVRIAWRIKHRARRLRLSLPSPFLVALLLVFVILPLAWPDGDDASRFPAAQAVFNLSGDVTTLAISADASHLAATCRDRPLWVWRQGREVDWGETLLPEHHPGGTRSLALSPDGLTLAAGNMDGTVSLWDTATGEKRADLHAGTEMILVVAFSPAGNRLACSSTDSRIYLWDLPAHRLLGTLCGHHGPVSTLAFSPGGQTLVSAGDDESIRLWSIDPARQLADLRTHEGIVLAVAFSADGNLVATTALAGQGVQLWDVSGRAECRVLHGTVTTYTTVAFTRHDESLVTGDEHGNLTFWDIAALKPKAVIPAHDGWVKGLASRPAVRPW